MNKCFKTISWTTGSRFYTTMCLSVGLSVCHSIKKLKNAKALVSWLGLHKHSLMSYLLVLFQLKFNCQNCSSRKEIYMVHRFLHTHARLILKQSSTKIKMIAEIQTWQNTKGQHTNCQNANLTKYKCNKIQMEQNTNRKKCKNYQNTITL